jgi:hypothetical protein
MTIELGRAQRRDARGLFRVAIFCFSVFRVAFSAVYFMAWDGSVS